MFSRALLTTVALAACCSSDNPVIAPPTLELLISAASGCAARNFLSLTTIAPVIPTPATAAKPTPPVIAPSAATPATLSAAPPHFVTICALVALSAALNALAASIAFFPSFLTPNMPPAASPAPTIPNGVAAINVNAAAFKTFPPSPSAAPRTVSLSFPSKPLMLGCLSIKLSIPLFNLSVLLNTHANLSSLSSALSDSSSSNAASTSSPLTSAAWLSSSISALALFLNASSSTFSSFSSSESCSFASASAASLFC